MCQMHSIGLSAKSAVATFLHQWACLCIKQRSIILKVSKFEHFFLDSDPVESAQMLCDKHLSKMQLEQAQLLSTAARHHLPEHLIPANCYKAAYVNHPSNVWCRASLGNVQWLTDYVEAMSNEWQTRVAGRQAHSSALVSRACCKALLRHWANTDAMTDVPLCMPEQYFAGLSKHVSIDIAVHSYRRYYIAEKAYFAKWPANRIPSWWPSDNL